MTEPKTIDCVCTRCKRTTSHNFEGRTGILFRFSCSVCGRDKLLTVAEVRA